MDISLIHAGLAAGAALAAVPVILHLFMKQTPKHVIFPALRLIRERQKRSQKRLRVKNWLLLLARMAPAGPDGAGPGAAAGSTRRRRSATRRCRRRSAWSSTPACRWGTRSKDKTRLDEAKERAGEILKKTPDSSQVFVIDSAEPGVAGRSPAGGRSKRIEGLTIRAGQPAAQRGGGPGLRRGRRLRPAAPRGLRPDRPGPLGLGPSGRPKGSTRSPRSIDKAPRWPRSSSG